MDALLHPRTWTWTRTRSTRHTPAELLLLPLLPNLHDDDIAAAAAAAAADDDEVVAEEKQADVVVVANVVEGTSVEVQVYVRRDVVADQFAVAVVEVVVVVDGGQRWRLRHLPCTIDVTVLGACPPPGVAVSFPPHFYLHCAGGVVVCS